MPVPGQGPAGIIPARAGFTYYRPQSAGALRDHPRSRGVYRRKETPCTRRLGSSPLARGLRGGGAHPPAARGIIPARAGFTTASTLVGSSNGDHPRSRGVYDERPRRRSGDAGSSPLARGLLHGVVGPLQLPGIIPARAGFTGRRRRCHSRPGDHPRSRGVYGVECCCGSHGKGSSPLARGLLPRTVRGPGAQRIIPARAGFTPRASSTGKPKSDHHRSRGVYSPDSVMTLIVCGSSPLARGLRHVGSGRLHVGGIIPARAGFTPRRWRRRRRGPDHPRSRGVYARAFLPASPRAGSSPLARGLHGLAVEVDAALRIIPARAGFTPPRRARRVRAQDHPRSRGVYVSGPPKWPSSAGSSPLARGLLEGGGPRRVHLRIIPARAGFTA